MKKRFIAIVVIVMLIATLSTACSPEGTVHSTTKQGEQEVVGHYHIFETPSITKYLQFLESFDETEYEIVDISKSDNYWYVTYRNIEE